MTLKRYPYDFYLSIRDHISNIWDYYNFSVAFDIPISQKRKQLFKLNEDDYCKIDIKKDINFLQEFEALLDWKLISSNSKVTEDLVYQFRDKIDWNKLIENKNISYPFLMINHYRINWKLISKTQTLKEEFIRYFEDKVDWLNISLYQTLSEEFVEEFKFKVNWDALIIIHYFSEEFFDRYKDMISSICYSRYKQRVKSRHNNTYQEHS